MVETIGALILALDVNALYPYRLPHDCWGLVDLRPSRDLGCLRLPPLQWTLVAMKHNPSTGLTRYKWCTISDLSVSKSAILDLKGDPIGSWNPALSHWTEYIRSWNLEEITELKMPCLTVQPHLPESLSK